MFCHSEFAETAISSLSLDSMTRARCCEAPEAFWDLRLLLIAAAAIGLAFSLTTFGPMVERRQHRGAARTVTVAASQSGIGGSGAFAKRRLVGHLGAQRFGLRRVRAWVLIVANVFATTRPWWPVRTSPRRTGVPLRPGCHALVGGLGARVGLAALSGLRHIAGCECARPRRAAILAASRGSGGHGCRAAPPPKRAAWIPARVVIGAGKSRPAHTPSGAPLGGLAGLAISAAILWITTAFLRVGSLADSRTTRATRWPLWPAGSAARSGASS